jgi:hypothetical protein
MNVEIWAEAALFPEKKYINGIAVAMQGSGVSGCKMNHDLSYRTRTKSELSGPFLARLGTQLQGKDRSQEL